MRRVLNLLQSTHMGFGLVTELNVYQCAGQPMPQDVEVSSCLPYHPCAQSRRPILSEYYYLRLICIQSTPLSHPSPAQGILRMLMQEDFTAALPLFISSLPLPRAHAVPYSSNLLPCPPIIA
jgi:hypothetical protein